MAPSDSAIFFFYFFFFFWIFNIFIQSSVSRLLQLLHWQTRGKGLLQFPRLLFVRDDQGVKVSAAPEFKLRTVLIFTDLDRFGFLSPGCEQEVFDLLNFARRGYEACRPRGWHCKVLTNKQDRKESCHFLYSYKGIRRHLISSSRNTAPPPKKKTENKRKRNPNTTGRN